MLFDSVAPEVKTMSFGSAPIRSAMCCMSSQPKGTDEIASDDVPSWRRLPPFQLPTHKHGFDYEDFHTDPSDMATWHRVLVDQRVW